MPTPAPDEPVPFDPGRVRVGYVANGVSAGLGLVLEEGRLLDSQRLVGAFQRFGTADAMKLALARSQLDLVIGMPPHLAAKLLEEDEPVVIAAANQVADEQLLVPAGSPIAALADVRGRLIGVPERGSSAEVGLARLLAAEGVEPGGYRTVSATESQLVAQLESGTIDGAVLRGLTIAGLPAPGRYRPVLDLGQAWQRAAGGPLVSGVIVMRRGFVEGYPEASARALAAVIAALRWGVDRPNEVAGLLVRNLKMTNINAANFARSWKSVYLIALDDPVVASLGALFQEYRAQGYLKEPPPPLLIDRGPLSRASELAR